MNVDVKKSDLLMLNIVKVCLNVFAILNVFVFGKVVKQLLHVLANKDELPYTINELYNGFVSRVDEIVTIGALVWLVILIFSFINQILLLKKSKKLNLLLRIEFGVLLGLIALGLVILFK